MKLKTKKIMGVALSLTMAATITASQVIAYAKEPARTPAASTEAVEAASFYQLTDSIDLSDIVNANLSENVIDYGEEEQIRNITGQNATKTVIVSLETESISEIKGNDMTVAEYLETTAGAKALKNIKNSQDKLLSDISSAGIAYKEVARYTTVLNAVAIEVNTAQFSKIAKLPNVSMAGISKTYAAPKAVDESKIITNYSKIYSTGIYDSSEIIEKYGYDGRGITVAILDTGLDYTHEAFSYEPDDPAFDREYVASRLANLDATSRTPGGLTVDDVYLSAKVPFAYDYSDNDADVYPSYSQHGVHVAGIVAGKAETYIDKDGHEVSDNGVDYKDEGVLYSFLGAAPEAQLVICKVFTDDLESDDLGGARSEDIISALDDCLKLGVDIINMSLGTTSGFSSIEIAGDKEGQQLKTCYENLKAEGISLIAAAGNEYSSGYGSEFGTNLASNPDSGTVGSPSTFVGSMSVASVNGQEAPYMIANPDENNAYANSPIYYNESNDSNAVPFDFAEELLGKEGEPGYKESETFTYYVVPGVGEPGDYSAIKSKIADKHKQGERVLVVVKRGKTNFKEKVMEAKNAGADGVIVYNNVPGTIRMSLTDIEEQDRIPSASVNMDAGTILTASPTMAGRLRDEGKITIDRTKSAGPFMNDYSSWGATPDLKLKPDITSHGGEILSAVSGGYQEMSGTSMATPNLAGLMALVRGYIKDQFPQYESNPAMLTQLTNQIVMSSATLLYDEEGLPYSPRKQGAGLATLDNIFTTQAYLYTDEQNGGAEDNRPKYELGDDKNKNGVYEFTFYATNFGDKEMNFKLVSRFFTETLASDGQAVAEAAYMLDDNPAEFRVDGQSTDTVTLGANGGMAEIHVKLTLSAAEKTYLDRSFVNGMYIEGFISLESQDEVDEVTGRNVQCDLNLPFMGFYGDWKAAPMLDYNAYEIAAIEQDASILEQDKPHESVYATQLFSTYYNGRYGVPMGGYAYVQDDSFGVEQIYVTEEHCSISRFNIYNGATAKDNYMTSTGIRALYAGLLRNAELVTYDIYNVNTGELIYTGENYRIGKAYANGGSATPSLVDLKLDPDTLGLINNNKYTIEFNFYMTAQEKGTETDNTFKTAFYVDYDAPQLVDSSIRYYNYKDGNDIKQRVYLDLDIFDNHYPQAVLLCYSNEEYQPGTRLDAIEINLATQYVTPIYNPVKNGTNRVTIEITDFFEEYCKTNRLYVQIDDYALNHNVYNIRFNDSNKSNAEEEFGFVLNDRVTRTYSGNNYVYNLTLEKNEMYRVELDCGSANASNYTWRSEDTYFISFKDNEIFGLEPTPSRMPAVITVSNLNTGDYIRLNVTVVDSNRTLTNPALTFGIIPDDNKALVKATGTVRVNAGQTFKLDVVSDPWYYPVDTLEFYWEARNPEGVELATVTQDGTVTTNNTRGVVEIRATATLPNGSARSASVMLSIQEPFRIDNMILNKYYGTERIVKIPDDENVMYIGEEAFEDNDTMEEVIIPKTVVEIAERAFINCTALKRVYFIDTVRAGDDQANINLILSYAFQGCDKLELLDLTNVKALTVAAYAFQDCTSLNEIRNMEKLGIAHNRAFAGCTSLKEVDISGLHTVGDNVFEGCTELETVITGHYTALGAGMFYGCTSLKELTIKNPRVSGSQRFSYRMLNQDGEEIELGFGGGAFENCENLKTVTFENDTKKDGSQWNTTFRIDPYAFRGCTNLETVNFNGLPVSYIGDFAFSNIQKLQTISIPDGTVLGNNVFSGTPVTVKWGSGYSEANGAVYANSGTTLVLAPANVTSAAFLNGVTEIAPYAFVNSTFGINELTLPESVEIIGEGAFYGANLRSVTISSNVEVISDYAFAYSSLQSIAIPATVKTVGAHAFDNCRQLATVTIANGVETIYDYAFSRTAIATVVVPESVKTMGSYVFYYCSNLTSATLTAVTELGDRTFERCSNLQSATFGANATASGNYTFFPGSYYTFVNDEPVEHFYNSSLTTVDLGGLTSLGEAVFWACANLTSIDLKNVTEVGKGVFTECTKLSTVIGLENVTKIGEIAFARVALKTINLQSATEIGDQAFFRVNATQISVPVAEKIGYQAFVGSSITKIEIPKTLKELGAGAFMMSEYLATVTVEEGNNTFFVDNNVLYRIIDNKKTGAQNTYELCLYPSALRASGNEGFENHYRVMDGTVTIQAWSFAYINSGMLTTVTLPYSVKTIGSYAFYNPLGYSTVSRYNFESIEAPTLLSDYYDLSIIDKSNINLPVFRSMYYANFGTEIIYYVPEPVGHGGNGDAVIAYPSNGTGYNNYVYSMYFGTKLSLGELMDDITRQLIEYVNSFDKATVESWKNLPVNDENKAMVQAFSEKVKEAHRLYNTISSNVQLGYLNKDENRADKLFDIENVLKDVKERFGISANISYVLIASDSAHKTVYKVGEVFDLTGLKLKVVNDDYSEENITDTSLMTLVSNWALESYETSVNVSYKGRTVRVPITVTAEGEQEPGGDQPIDPVPPSEGGSGCAGCGSMDIGSTLGGTGLLLLTMAGAMLLMRKVRRKANK